MSIKELSTAKKASLCLGVLIVLFLIFIIASSLLSFEEYDNQEIKDLRAQYDSYDLFVERYYAWSNSIYNNDSEPTNISDVLRDDARTAIEDMHNGGMSKDEIYHGINEPARMAYEEGIVDSPVLYDEEFVERAIS